MKPTEEAVMEVLRKSTLSHLSEKEYAEIVEAVEKQGLMNLSGAALRIVSGAVKKHGSHNQASHGRRGGGGGGGGGGSSSSPKRIDPFTGKPTDHPMGVNPDTGLTFQQEVTARISQTADRARDITNELEQNPINDPTRDLARKKAYTMRESIDRAYRANTPEGAKEGLKSARSQIKPIIEMLEDQNYNSEASNLGELATNITSVITVINRGF